jgi:membrane-associated phospholipid phosphatase
VFTLVLALALAQTPDLQTEAISHPNAAHELKLNWPVDLTVTGAGLVAWVGSEVALKHVLSPTSCRWCDQLPEGTSALNPVDRWGRGAKWDESELLLADGLSNAVDFVALPAAVFGLHGYLAASNQNWKNAHQDLLIIMESVAVAAVLNQGTKFLAGRERPFVSVLSADDKPLTAKPDDNNLSFYSGHASFAFSLLASSITVAELRGYQHRWLLYAVGLPLAISVPYLRMAADRHYLTDVTVGTLVGSAIGVGVPLLFHGRQELPVSVSAGPGGVSVSGQF